MRSRRVRSASDVSARPPGRIYAPLLDSAQKRSYDLGLPLSVPAGPKGGQGVRLQPNFRSWFRGAGRCPAGKAFMSTFIADAARTSESARWHVIDADGQVLGRIATAASRLLQGKHKAVYTPFIDTGDFVVVVNAAKVKLTGRKEDQKIYRQHSGYEGGLREERARLVRQRK